MILITTTTETTSCKDQFRLDATAAILECGGPGEVGTYRKSNVHQVLELSHRFKSTIFSKATNM